MDTTPYQPIVLEAVESIVTSVVVLLLGGVNISSNAPLMDAGVDSLSATELVEQLGVEFSTEIPATSFFDHPSIRAMTLHLSSAL